jgi:hypothetical protein
MEPQSRTFILGVLSCLEVQTPRADSLAGDPCLDKSRFAGNGSAWGTRITVRGIMVKDYGVQRLRLMQDAAGGPRSGVVAYNVPFGMQVGRKYLLACAAMEFYTMTELSNPVALIDEGVVAVPAPQLSTVGALADVSCDPNQETLNGEDYEGVLIRVENVKVVPFNTEPRLPSPGGAFRIAGPAPSYPDTILVSNYNATYTTATALDTGAVVHVNGMLHVDEFGSRIYPRDDSDIEIVIHIGAEPKALAALSFSVHPNPGTAQRVSFVLPQKARVELGVYDLLGRRVTVLAKGELAAGEYARNWNGRAADGTQTPSGVYFYRLVVGKEIRTLRAVKLN